MLTFLNYQSVSEEILKGEYEIPFHENIDEIRNCATLLLDNAALLDLSTELKKHADNTSKIDEVIKQLKGRIPTSHIEHLQKETNESIKQLEHFMRKFKTELSKTPNYVEMCRLVEDTKNFELYDPLDALFERQRKLIELIRKKKKGK
jgi:predicted transcriptional regulator